MHIPGEAPDSFWSSDMSDLERVKLQVQDQVALVTIDQPELLNCLSGKTLEELERVFSERLK